VPGVAAQSPAAPGIAGTAIPTPREVLRALLSQREELRSQKNSLTSERYSIARRLREGEVSGVDKAGLEARMQELDARILDVTKALAVADQRVVEQKGIPGASTAASPGDAQSKTIPVEFAWMGFSLAVIVLLPLSIAWARRIWRRGSAAPSAAAQSRELDERLSRLEQAMDAVAVEVERVGEGQRYVTRILGAGAAQPLAVRAREGVEVPR
jgi:hypothetical protein